MNWVAFIMFVNICGLIGIGIGRWIETDPIKEFNQQYIRYKYTIEFEDGSSREFYAHLTNFVSTTKTATFYTVDDVRIIEKNGTTFCLPEYTEIEQFSGVESVDKTPSSVELLNVSYDTVEDEVLHFSLTEQ